MLSFELTVVDGTQKPSSLFPSFFFFLQTHLGFRWADCYHRWIFCRKVKGSLAAATCRWHNPVLRNPRIPSACPSHPLHPIVPLPSKWSRKTMLFCAIRPFRLITRPSLFFFFFYFFLLLLLCLLIRQDFLSQLKYLIRCCSLPVLVQGGKLTLHGAIMIIEIQTGLSTWSFPNGADPFLVLSRIRLGTRLNRIYVILDPDATVRLNKRFKIELYYGRKKTWWNIIESKRKRRFGVRTHSSPPPPSKKKKKKENPVIFVIRVSTSKKTLKRRRKN